MFKKIECSNCGKKIKNSYGFCPFCGNQTKKKQEDFGMLGQNDTQENLENFSQNIFGGFGGGILNKMLSQTMKMLEKEMQKEMKNQQKMPKTNMQLFINGKKVDLQNMQQQKMPEKKEKNKIKSLHFSQSNQEKFASLSQKEPKTNIRRLDDKVIYEINLPKIDSIKNISIVKLENSIEVKAISKNAAYFKSIPINLDLTDYMLENEKLILEFEN